MASEAPLAVILRRGPSKQVCTVLWNRKQDTFHLGQWFKGQIYAHRCDLSPNGLNLIYFALKGRKTEADTTWTAISRAPYLKAEVLFAKGDTWHGGGLWVSNTEYWLNDGYGHRVVRNNALYKQNAQVWPLGWDGGSWQSRSVYFARLLRDGWKPLSAEPLTEKHNAHTFTKPVTKGWVLRKQFQVGNNRELGRGCGWEGHELFREQNGVQLPYPNWEWADWDGNRIVWATAGRLETGKLTTTGLTDIRVLEDFNDMKFEAIKAPY